MTTETRKPRLSKPVASAKLIQSAITLMKANPIGDVSALKICAHAGVDKMTVRYCFGSYAGLLIATATTLGQGISRFLQDGVFDPEAYRDPDSVLFGKLVAYLYASMGDKMPVVELSQLPNITLLQKQIEETYGIKPVLAQALAKRASHIAVATVAMDRFVPLTDAEIGMVGEAQRRMYQHVATVQDQIINGNKL